MKTPWIAVMLAALGAADLARAQVDFHSAREIGICALGRIVEVRQGEPDPNPWAIEVTDVRILWRGAACSETAVKGICVKAPAKVTLSLTTGLGGVLVEPQPGWVGRLALFMVTEYKGAYGVSGFGLPLSPDGKSFVVFASDQASTVRSIEQAAQILDLTDLVAQRRRLKELAESPTEPLFLRSFAVGEFAWIAREGSRVNPEARSQLRKWRDDRRFAPELRVYADEELGDASPRAYLWSGERLSFLRKLKDAPEASSEVGRHVARRIEEAERSKASAVPKKE
jgi:hypothetical protein